MGYIKINRHTYIDAKPTLNNTNSIDPKEGKIETVSNILFIEKHI